MHFKKPILFALIGALLLGLMLSGCSGGQSPSADVSPNQASETAEEANSKAKTNSVFDGTYWHLSFGPTNGVNYAAKFSDDGTFVSVCFGGERICNGTYEYDGSKLIISVDGHDNIEFVPNGDGFVSVEEFVAQQYYNYHCTAEKISEDEFNGFYEPLSAKDSAEQTVLNYLSEYIECAKNILNDDIGHAETVYGKATELKAEPSYMMFTFDNAPVKFKIEYYYAEPTQGTIYISVDEMGLSSSELSELKEACSTAYAKTDTIYADIKNGHNGLSGCKLTIVGFDNGHFGEYMGFIINSVK